MDVETTKELVAEAVRLKLDGADRVAARPVEELAADFNGIGPEWFPEWVRQLLDDAYPFFLSSAMIHDDDYRHGDGSVVGFLDANRRLGENCRKAVLEEFGWYNPRRYKMLDKAGQFKFACDAFGWPVYKKACRENKTRERKTT